MIKEIHTGTGLNCPPVSSPSLSLLSAGRSRCVGRDSKNTLNEKYV